MVPQPQSVIQLTRQTMPIFLSIFGDIPEGSTFRGRRKAVRRPTRTPIEFLCMYSPTNAEMCPGTCVDISEDGIGFRSPVELDVGQTIQVFLTGEAQDYSIGARIVHCTSKGAFYRVGAKFVWK